MNKLAILFLVAVGSVLIIRSGATTLEGIEEMIAYLSNESQGILNELDDMSIEFKEIVKGLQDTRRLLPSNNQTMLGILNSWLPKFTLFLSRINMDSTARHMAESIGILMLWADNPGTAKELVRLLVPWLDSPNRETLDAVTLTLDITIKRLSNNDADEVIRNFVIPKLKEVGMTVGHYPFENSLKMIRALVEKNCDYAQSFINGQFMMEFKQSSGVIDESKYTKNILTALSEVAKAISKCDPKLQQYFAGEKLEFDSVRNHDVNNAKESKLASRGAATTAEPLTNKNKKKGIRKCNGLCGLFE